MFYIDTHTHLYDEAFSEDADEAIARAVGAGVGKMVVPGTCSRDYGLVRGLCGRYPGVLFPALGLHPEEVTDSWREEIGILESEDLGNVVAIGEVGLDLHWSAEFEAAQKDAFAAQVALAIEKDLPLIIHSRDATEKTLDVLRAFPPASLRGVFHAYSGSAETARELERLGDWYIGIGGVLTYKKAGIAKALETIPLERIILETDSPYLPPVPHRGERNESAYIPVIAAKIAEIKGVPIEEVAARTTENAEKLFRI